ncbi:MAG: hypothetical protein AAGB05_12515 [Pseudomonadota bacterium]
MGDRRADARTPGSGGADGPAVTFGPQTRRDPRAFGLLSLCAAGWLWLAYDVARTEAQGPGSGALGMAVVAGVTFAIGAATWWFSPLAQGRLSAGPAGVAFEQWRGRTVAPKAFGWSELSAVRLKRGAWGRLRLGFVARPVAGGSAAQVTWIDVAGLDLVELDLAGLDFAGRDPGARGLIDTIGTVAEGAGYALKAVGKTARSGRIRRAARWQVVARPKGVA